MLSSLVNAQGIIINKGSNLVFNGNVALVVNDASLKNDGTFTASTGTVKFSGIADTLTSHVAGSQTTTFYNLSVSKSAYGVALKSPVGVRNVLAVNGGNLYTDSNLTLISDAALTAKVAAVAATSRIIGKANVERYIPVKRAWRLITAPVNNSNTIYNSWQNRGVYTPGIGTLVTGPNPTGTRGNGLDASAQNTISLKRWNTAAASFTNVSNTHVPLSMGTTGQADNSAYFMFIRGDRNPGNTSVSNQNTTTLTAVGSLQTGTQTFSALGKANAYTLIGNPYASPVDFNKLKTKNLVKRFYVWEPKINTLGSYVMMDDLDNDGIFVKSVVISSNTNNIQSGQAFFVQTKQDGEASITFEESNKSDENNTMVFRPQTPNKPAGFGVGQIRTILNLREADNSTLIADGAIAEFNDIYSAGVDNDDAAKLANVNESISILSSRTSLVAERRPALRFNDTLFLKIAKMVQRNYQFEFIADGLEQPNMVGFVLDNHLNTSTPINLSGVTLLDFSVDGTPGSSAANRFTIVFKEVSVLPVTLSHVMAYQKNNNVAVEWKVTNEINMSKYDVERSIDGNVFTTATTILVSGTNNATNAYSWLDVNAAKGNNFYRVKTYDISGQVHYSTIMKVAMGNTDASFGVYPNPVTGNVINLQVNNQPTGIYTIRLSGSTGQMLYTSDIKHNGGNSNMAINIGSKLPAGIYQLEVIGADTNHHTQKVIIK